MGVIKTKKISDDLKKLAQPGDTKLRSSLSVDKEIGEFYYIETNKVIPYKNQSREYFDEEELKNLAVTIKKHGVRQPLTIIPSETKKGFYEVVSGERRLRAAKLIELKRVPCQIITDDKKACELSIIENIQRSDLHPLETAKSLKKLIDIGYTQKDICHNLGLQKSYVSEILKYINFSEKVQRYLIQNKITSRDFLRNLLKSPNPEAVLNMKSLLPNPNKGRSKSIFRIYLREGEYHLQKSSLKKLSFDEKQRIKKELLQVITEYLSD